VNAPLSNHVTTTKEIWKKGVLNTRLRRRHRCEF